MKNFLKLTSQVNVAIKFTIPIKYFTFQNILFLCYVKYSFFPQRMNAPNSKCDFTALQNGHFHIFLQKSIKIGPLNFVTPIVVYSVASVLSMQSETRDFSDFFVNSTRTRPIFNLQPHIDMIQCKLAFGTTLN